MNQKSLGFSLIEVSIALFIIGLVLSGFIALANTLVTNRQIDATRTKQEAIKAALLAFVARNHRLPCPTVPTQSEEATAYGLEALPSGGSCTGLTAMGAVGNEVVTGSVPWISLGLTKEGALDAYANRFTYQVTLAATALTSSTVSGMSGRISVHSAGPAILGSAPAGNQTNLCAVTGSINPCAAVTVIVSHGKDGYGAYTRSGARFPFDDAITGNDARENADPAAVAPDSRFVTRDYSGTSDNPFDDIVMSLTANDLLAPLVASGALRDYRSALNKTFQNMLAAAAGFATENRSGVSGTREYRLPSTAQFASLLSSAQMVDPWGNPVAYAPNSAIAPITSGTDPSAWAITLTSYGPDKAPAGGDDIIHTVYVAELKNIFQLSGW